MRNHSNECKINLRNLRIIKLWKRHSKRTILHLPAFLGICVIYLAHFLIVCFPKMYAFLLFSMITVYIMIYVSGFCIKCHTWDPHN